MRVFIPSLVAALAAMSPLTAQEQPTPTPTPEGTAARSSALGFGQAGKPARSLAEVAARTKLKNFTPDEIKEMFSAAAKAPAANADGSDAATDGRESSDSGSSIAVSPTLRPLALGKADYDLKLETLNGTPFDAHTLQGKTVLLNFWATWCHPCVAEMPSIQRFYEGASAAGVSVLALSNEKVETIAGFLKDHPYSFPIYRLVGERPEAYQSTEIPVTFILTPDGRIASRHVGSRAWEDGSIMASLKTVARPRG